MADYRFGREVTLKLPGPTHMPVSTGKVEVEEWIGDGWLVRKVGPIYVAHPRGPEPILSRLITGNGGHLKSFALAVLAAADYAENGDHT